MITNVFLQSPWHDDLCADKSLELNERVKVSVKTRGHQVFAELLYQRKRKNSTTPGTGLRIVSWSLRNQALFWLISKIDLMMIKDLVLSTVNLY